MINILFIEDIPKLAKSQIEMFYDVFKGIKSNNSDIWPSDFEILELDNTSESFKVKGSTEEIHFSSYIVELNKNEDLDSKFEECINEVDWTVPTLFVVDICLGMDDHYTTQMGIPFAEKMQNYISLNNYKGKVINTTGSVSAARNEDKDIPVVLRSTYYDGINIAFPADAPSIFSDRDIDDSSMFKSLVESLLHNQYVNIQYIGVVMLCASEMLDK